MKTFEEYQKVSVLAANRSVDEAVKDIDEHLLLNSLSNLKVEAGKVSEIIENFHHKGKGIDKDDIIKNLGFILWNVAAIATALNIDMEEIISKNMEELKKLVLSNE